MSSFVQVLAAVIRSLSNGIAHTCTSFKSHRILTPDMNTQPLHCAAHFQRRSGLLFPGCEMCCAFACAFDSPPAILRHAPVCLPGAGPGFEAGSLLGCVPAGPKKGGIDSSLEGHRSDLDWLYGTGRHSLRRTAIEECRSRPREYAPRVA
jgi:hypothetical protein